MKKKNIIIISVVVAVVVIAIIVALLVSNVFKSEKQLFAQYLSQMSEGEKILETNIFNTYTDKKESTPYQNSGEITLSLPEEMESFSSFNIKVEGKSNPGEKKYESKISLNNGETAILPMTLRQVNDTYGIQFDDIVEQFVAIENNNLKAFAEKLGITDLEAIPDKIELSNYDNLFTQDEIKEIEERYKTVIAQAGEDKEYIKVEKDGMTGYQLTLSDDDFRRVIENLLTTFKDDTLIRSKLEQVYTDLGTETVDELYTQIEDLIVEIQNEESMGIADFLKITVYEKGNKLQNVEIEIGDTEGKMVISIISREDKFEITLDGTGMQSLSKSINENNDKEVAMSSNTLNYSTSMDDELYTNGLDSLPTTSMGTSVNYMRVFIDKTAQGENIVYNMGMQMGESQDNITMEMTMDMNYNGIKSMQSIDEIYNISIKDNSSNTEIGIDFNNKVEFVDSVEIEDFTDENSELLNEKDAQYIQQLLTQLTQLISESVMTGISESGNMMQNNMNGLGY